MSFGVWRQFFVIEATCIRSQEKNRRSYKLRGVLSILSQEETFEKELLDELQSWSVLIFHFRVQKDVHHRETETETEEQVMTREKDGRTRSTGHLEVLCCYRAQ
jgi:hypothetical protein